MRRKNNTIELFGCQWSMLRAGNSHIKTSIDFLRTDGDFHKHYAKAGGSKKADRSSGGQRFSKRFVTATRRRSPINFQWSAHVHTRTLNSISLFPTTWNAALMSFVCKGKAKDYISSPKQSRPLILHRWVLSVGDRTLIWIVDLTTCFTIKCVFSSTSPWKLLQLFVLPLFSMPHIDFVEMETLTHKYLQRKDKV